MTPFQEQGLLRQLKALRSTPLREGFETELLERLEQAAVGDERPSPLSARRGRGKLILLAAIFVPFAAAASELAWRAIHSMPARSQLAKDDTTVVSKPFVPSRNAMFEPGLLKQLAKATMKPDFRYVDNQASSQQTVAHAAARSKLPQAEAQRTQSGASTTGDAPPSSRVVQASPPIERLAPNWNGLRQSGASSASGLQSSQTALRLAPAASPAAAADNHAVERRSETRAGERRGNGAGERDQHRERVRQGQ